MAKTQNGASDYEVGYGKPPKAGQFKPGQSGNPSGKRRGKHLGRMVDDELGVRISVTEGGKTVRLTKAELMVKSLVNQAVKGDLRAIGMLSGMVGGGPEEAPVDLSGISPAMVASFLKRHNGGSKPGPDGEGEGCHAD